MIYDRFKEQCTPGVLELLEKNDIDLVLVPANCTDRLQPLDISVNEAAKNIMRDKFQGWYAEQIQQQISDQICNWDGSLPLAIAVITAMANKPQSVPPRCIWY